jgi:hemerythrin superfamily protein
MPVTRNKPSEQKKDAIDLLTADHVAVDKLFKQFEKLADDGDAGAKAGCVEQICAALTVHATIEEEIFYPAAREVLEEEDLLDEAEVEHDGIKGLVADLEGMSPEDDLYDAKVTVLGEYVKHHVREEQDDMFPKVKKAKVDTVALGRRLSARKKELEEEKAPAVA